MAGVLSFALGLESSAFASGLDRAGGRLLAFLSIGKAVSETIEGVMGAIERGAALNDLSARTGESVENLYQLQEAFKVVGISTDSLPGMINRFNKSLSGVGEMGEKTTDAFAALGLNMDDLKKMDAPTQLSTIAEKLNQLDKGSAMDVASRLFGREGAANLMQMSRDLESFKETMAQSAREAAVLARNAAAFDKLGDTFTRVKGGLEGMFAGVAEAIAPILQRVADWLNSLDFVSFGQNLGNAIAVGTEIITSGRLGEMLEVSFTAAVERFGNLISNGNFWTGFSEMILGAFAMAEGGIMKIVLNIGIGLKSALDTAFQQFYAWLGGTKFGKWLGIGGFQAQTFGEIYAQNKMDNAPAFKAIDEFTTGGKDLFKMGADSFAKAWAESATGPEQEKFNGLIGEMQKTINNRNFEADLGKYLDLLTADPETMFPDKKTLTNDTKETSKPNVTAWEKIGLIFKSGSGFDPAKQTANNTRKSLDYLKIISEKITNPTATSLTNAA